MRVLPWLLRLDKPMQRGLALAAHAALSTAFLGSLFSGDGTALRQWAQRFGGLLARCSAP